MVGASAIDIFRAGNTPGRECLSDMAGNVLEWTLSDYYSRTDLNDFRFDEASAGLFIADRMEEDISKTKGKMAFVKGGAFFLNHEDARCATRKTTPPDFEFNISVGFRCARTVS